MKKIITIFFVIVMTLNSSFAGYYSDYTTTNNLFTKTQINKLNNIAGNIVKSLRNSEKNDYSLSLEDQASNSIERAKVMIAKYSAKNDKVDTYKGKVAEKTFIFYKLAFEKILEGLNKYVSDKQDRLNEYKGIFGDGNDTQNTSTLIDGLLGTGSSSSPVSSATGYTNDSKGFDVIYSYCNIGLSESDVKFEYDSDLLAQAQKTFGSSVNQTDINTFKTNFVKTMNFGLCFLKNKGLLSDSDVNTIKSVPIKIRVESSKTFIEMRIGDNASSSSYKLEYIKTVFNPYLNNFSKNGYREIGTFLHEIGHYKENSNGGYSNFTNICWSNGSNSCSSSDFVSTYGKTNKYEDFATVWEAVLTNIVYNTYDIKQYSSKFTSVDLSNVSTKLQKKIDFINSLFPN